MSHWSGSGYIATDGVCWLDGPPRTPGLGGQAWPRAMTKGELAMAYARAAKAARKARKAEYLTGRRLVWRRIEARQPQEWWGR